MPLALIDDLLVLKTGTGSLADEYEVCILTELRKPPDQGICTDRCEAGIRRIREEIRASRRMTDLERLQWLEEICVFINMFRQAPEVVRSEPAALAPGGF